MKVSRNQNTLVLSNQEVFDLFDAITIAWEGWFEDDGRTEAENPYESMLRQVTELKNAVVHGVSIPEEK